MTKTPPQTPVTPTPTRSPTPTPTNTNTPTVSPFIWDHELAGLTTYPVPPNTAVGTFDCVHNLGTCLYIIGYIDVRFYYNGNVEDYNLPNALYIYTSSNQYGFSAGDQVCVVTYPAIREGTSFAFRFNPNGPVYSGTFTNGNSYFFP